MSKHAFVLLAGLLASAAPAMATGEISCGDGEGVGIDLLVGHVDVLSVSRVVVTVGDKMWSSTPKSWPGTPIAVGQAFEDDRQLVLDITDEGVNEIIGRLRVFKASEGETSVASGVFAWKGEGAFVVDCSEPQ
ncbi:hypothetical protein RB623_02245 [Mesorhizobium sp. LHD-90]|uniref:hypothetical protein n=1 Tax=Mesorhizobium sp. LHD-90 TaxID=3071414 RepID=UPI0027DFA055|nr:hypothetical protein [Mesorhizobium sp. LHD-90]MDQ6432872.1 hypothetical protein [Mesorhizobium sp. LHD-90]